LLRQQEEENICSCIPEEEPVVGRRYFWWTNRLEQANSGLTRAVQETVFLPLVRNIFYRSRTKLLSPSEYGLERAANFYISHGEAAVLGAWFLWPEGGASKPEDIPASGCLVVYFHGNAQDRGFGHRVQLYKELVGLGCHVLAFDYRSYGDSSRVSLTETSVVEDGLAVLAWVEEAVGDDPPQVVVWGHSLGTAIATRALVTFNFTAVLGLILESPFNTMEDEATSIKMAKVLAWAAGWDLAEELRAADVEFRTESWLAQVEAPVLVLHASDDQVVPLELGERLVERAKERGKEDIEMVTFGAELNLGHRYIHRAPGIAGVIRAFLNSTRAPHGSTLAERCFQCQDDPGLSGCWDKVTHNHISSPRANNLLSQVFICDGFEQCGDGSDEGAAPGQGCNLFPSSGCSSDNGDRHWRCDRTGECFKTEGEAEECQVGSTHTAFLNLTRTTQGSTGQSSNRDPVSGIGTPGL
jgi:pimeloyl-ACP methyl ester carboxylesterase